MKDSGIDWIGEIPNDWELSKIKYIFDEVKFTDFDHENTDLLSLTQKGLVRRDISNNEGQIAEIFYNWINRISATIDEIEKNEKNKRK